MPDPLAAKIRPGFPRLSNDGKSHRTAIEYVGLYDDLFAGCPVLGEEHGDYIGRVNLADIQPLEGTEWAILVVNVEYQFDQGDSPAEGEKRETAYEVDWMDVQRSFYEHPKFATGGTYALTNTDVAAIKLWEAETKIERKDLYKYQSTDPSNGYSAEYDLTPNARMFARGIELGQEFWVDKMPVATMIETYVNGLPPAGTAGQKEDPPGGFPSLPTGYEWLRSTDRGVRAGGQNKWERTVQWIGSDQVLADVDDIFWAAPE